MFAHIAAKASVPAITIELTPASSVWTCASPAFARTQAPKALEPV